MRRRQTNYLITEKYCLKTLLNLEISDILESFFVFYFSLSLYFEKVFNILNSYVKLCLCYVKFLSYWYPAIIFRNIVDVFPYRGNEFVGQI